MNLSFRFYMIIILLRRKMFGANHNLLFVTLTFGPGEFTMLLI